MYPGVIVDYEDQSNIASVVVETTEVRNTPLFCAVFTSDKGTEKWTRISGESFFNMYGKSISFSRHGQPLLQAAASISAGAELLCKRLVADDATLANIGIIAKLGTTEKTVTEQKTDADGKPLYYEVDEQGAATTTEVTTVTAYPVMVEKPVTVNTVSYRTESAVGASDAKDAYEKVKANLAEGEYLIYMIADNGRGSSKKRIKIVPNYKLSKNLGYTYYTFAVIEDSGETESFSFALNPSTIQYNVNISLKAMIDTNATQISCYAVDEDMDNFVAAVENALGLDAGEGYGLDLLFGYDYRGTAMDNFVIAEGSEDLQYAYGITLLNGDNGSFGNRPIGNETEWVKQATAAFNGKFDPVIFNVEQYKISAIIDANYPDAVKRVIETLAVFREDFMYFRDQGLGQNSISLIEAKCESEVKSMFCATYPQSYDVIDPYTKRQISVTIGYSLAKLLVAHLNNGSILPSAGMKFGMVIGDAVYGTLSFAPTICPEENQKEVLDDMRVNYASYIDNQLVIETLYTSQEKYTQWSYINNVMGIQEVVKAIRTKCPAIRYSFITGDDLENYKADVDEILDAYRSNFATLELEYISNATYAANKIFYAILNVAYKNFVQTEWFKVTAIQTEQ